VNPTQSDDVVFPSTIPLGHSTILMPSGIGEAHSLEFDNAYTLNGSLVINTGNVTVASGVTATLSAHFAGSHGHHKRGNGTLIDNSSSTNTFLGPVSVDAGVLQVASDGYFSQNSSTLTINSATLRLTGTSFFSTRSWTLGSVTSTIETPSGAA